MNEAENDSLINAMYSKVKMRGSILYLTKDIIFKPKHILEEFETSKWNSRFLGFIKFGLFINQTNKYMHCLFKNNKNIHRTHTHTHTHTQIDRHV